MPKTHDKHHPATTYSESGKKIEAHLSQRFDFGNIMRLIDNFINMKSLVQKIDRCWQISRLSKMTTSKNVRSERNNDVEETSTNYLEMIAIENSANCNLRCKACPTVYARDYPKKFMSMETFKRICENITPDIVPKVALMGWGEPFLDPCYFEKLDWLKKNSYYVGSTSNFSLLNEDLASNIVNSNLDHLNISIDINHFNASGMSLKEMIKKVDILLKISDVRSSPLLIGVIIVAFKSSYHLVRDILLSLKEYPRIFIDIIPLWYLPSTEIYAESMSKQEFIFFKKRIMEEFGNMRIYFDFALNEDKILANCRSNVFKTAYINYKGEVVPCSTLAMEFPNITYSGELGWTQKLSFGRLDQMGLKDIWESENYCLFRKQFRQKNLPDHCRYCNLWRELP